MSPYRTQFATTFRPSYSLPRGFRRSARPGAPAITKHKVTLKLLTLWSAFLELRLKRAQARHERNPSEGASVKLARAFLRLSRPAEALSIAQQAKKRFPESHVVKEIYQEARRGRATILLQETTDRRGIRSGALSGLELCRTLETWRSSPSTRRRIFPRPAGYPHPSWANSARVRSRASDGRSQCRKHLQRARS
jgi:hypothetical protein